MQQQPGYRLIGTKYQLTKPYYLVDAVFDLPTGGNYKPTGGKPGRTVQPTQVRYAIEIPKLSNAQRRKRQREIAALPVASLAEVARGRKEAAE
jgi:hypothetical protein